MLCSTMYQPWDKLRLLDFGFAQRCCNTGMQQLCLNVSNVQLRAPSFEAQLSAL